MLNTIKVKLPDRNLVTIREANGEDEGILSQIDQALTGMAIPTYLASLLQGGSESPKDVVKWKINSLNFLLLKARMLTYGEELKFRHICTNPKCSYHKRGAEVECTEDLRRWDWEAETSTTLEPGKHIIEYPNTDEVYMEKTLASGKKIRMEYLTGSVQSELMQIPEDKLNQGSDLLCRKLQIWGESNWDTLNSLKSLTGRDMMEIRGLIKAKEPHFDMTVDILCSECKVENKINMISLPDFFYPMA